jgi:hypothetical protein
VARLIVPGDFDPAGQDDTKPVTDFASLGQRLANLKGAHLAEPPDALDLERLKRRNICSRRVSMIDGVGTEIMCRFYGDVACCSNM